MAVFSITWLIYLAVIIVGIPVGIVCVYADFIFIQRWRYSHIPTPPISRFLSGHASDFEKLSKQGPTFGPFALKWFVILKTDIICFWFFHVPVIVVTGIDNVKEILINKAHSKPKEVQQVFARPFGERFMTNGLLSILDYETWKPKRHLLNPAFHRTYLKDLVPVFNHTCDLMLDRLRKVADGKTEVKMYDEFLKCTLNVIANAGCGLDVDLINNRTGLANIVPHIMEGMQYLIMHPFYYLNPFSGNYVEQFRESIRKLRKIGRDVILKRQHELAEGKEMEKDLVSFIVQAVDKDPTLSVEDLVDEYATFFVAGHETTGSLLGISLLLIASHPEVQQKLTDEIDNVLGSKKTVDVEDLPKMSYMGQVFKEALRIWPAVSLTSRIIPKGHVIAGYKMPASITVMALEVTGYRHNYVRLLSQNSLEDVELPVQVGNCRSLKNLWFEKRDWILKLKAKLFPEEIRVFDQLTLRRVATNQEEVSFYANQRHPKYWTDPEQFDPNRFSEGRKFEPMMYAPFSAGARNCIGQHMAQIEAKVLLGRFLQEFKFSLTPDQDLGFQETGTLKPKDGTKGTLVIRKKDN